MPNFYVAKILYEVVQICPHITLQSSEVTS